eukprot:SAG11_NODE_1375_length_5086_cov_98.730499_4_plen_127_part_00
MDPTRGALVLVAFYCDERQWLGSGCDGDAWPAVDIVQRIAMASPALYFSDLRCLTCLTSHRYCFRLGEYTGLEPRLVTVQELRRFDQSYDRRFVSLYGMELCIRKAGLDGEGDWCELSGRFDASQA